MVGKRKDSSPSSSKDEGCSCCKVESVVSVDERGQMVLPKDLRAKANIRAGDKLAVIGWEKGGEVCCISLVKADAMTDIVRGLLGPMMEDMLAG